MGGEWEYSAMAVRHAKDTGAREERLRAWLRERCEAGYGSPWFDCSKSYDFPVCTPEQLQWLNSTQSRWARPAVSLDEVLRRSPRHQPGVRPKTMRARACDRPGSGVGTLQAVPCVDWHSAHN